MSLNYYYKICGNVRSLWNTEKHYPDCEIILLLKDSLKVLNVNTQCAFLITERKTLVIFRNANKKKGQRNMQ